MKRVVTAGTDTKTIIFEDENFKFVKESGTGINGLSWEGLTVESVNFAKKHVVEVRLEISSRKTILDEEENTKIYGYSGAYVSHGFRSVSDTLEETAEYIEVLQDALDFAQRVNEWLADNQ